MSGERPKQELCASHVAKSYNATLCLTAITAMRPTRRRSWRWTDWRPKGRGVILGREAASVAVLDMHGAIISTIPTTVASRRRALRPHCARGTIDEYAPCPGGRPTGRTPSTTALFNSSRRSTRPPCLWICISDASTPNLPGLAIRYRPGRTTRTRGRRSGRGSRLGRLEPHLGRFLTVRSANEVRVGRTITF